jgi:hypothetical protein
MLLPTAMISIASISPTISNFTVAVQGQRQKIPRFSTSSQQTTALTNLFVCPNRLQHDRLGSLMLHKLENDPQIVSRATGPRTLQFTFQLMRSQLWMEASSANNSKAARIPSATRGSFLTLCFAARTKALDRSNRRLMTISLLSIRLASRGERSRP